MPKVAVLAHLGDSGAVALAAHLRRRGHAKVVYADERALAGARLVHHPPSGAPDGKITAPMSDSVLLSDGSVVDEATDLIICRLSAFPPARQATKERQDYADAEAYAVALSWLAGLDGRVLNRPSPMGLGGRQPDVLSLAVLAAEVGLSTPRLRLATNGVSTAPSGWGRQSWSGPTPVAVPTQTGPAVTPPLPMPVMFTEPVEFRTVAAVAGGRVVGAPPGLEERVAALVEAAELNVAEVAFGATVSGDAPLVLSVRPVPRVVDIHQLDLLTWYAEQRAFSYYTSRAV
jgi:hypothetical protein